MRKAQLQTLEPIIIMMVLVLIGGIALIFYSRAVEVQVSNDHELDLLQQDLRLLGILSAMPEFSCTGDITQNTKCIDQEKAIAFAQILKDQRTKLTYVPILGDTNISVIYLATPDAIPQTINIYDGLSKPEAVMVSRTYFVLYDPAQERKQFATLQIERSR